MTDFFPNQHWPRTAFAPEHITGRLLDRLLPNLEAGRLRLVLPGGRFVERIGPQPGPECAIEIRRWRGLWRILAESEDGVLNAYMDGDWTTGDLVGLLELGARNEALLTTRSWLFGSLRSRIGHALRANTRRGSRRNIAAHYDLGNDFFGAWLDPGMNYSSALFVDDEPLERAQLRKLDRIAALLNLHSSETVLEIGCGWGALAERLIRYHGTRVTAITLSTEQLAYAAARLAPEARDGRADLRLADYRDVGGRFNRIASIEMIEAVGERYWPTYFTKLRELLAPGGIAVIQAITIDEKRFPAYRKRPDFIQRYIFPGGMLPTDAIMMREAARAGLVTAHHEAFGESYARTLRDWRIRFVEALPKLESLGLSKRFLRLWHYYLAYCEVGFRLGSVDVGLYKFTG